MPKSLNLSGGAYPPSVTNGPSYLILPGGIVVSAIHKKNGLVHGKFIVKLSQYQVQVAEYKDGVELGFPKLVEMSVIAPFSCKDMMHTDCEFS
jgi:hypothetical protein